MSQTNRILNYLQKGYKLSPLKVLRLFSCFRLASRINEIRQAGFKVKTNMIKRNKKTYANYCLDK